MPGKFEGLNDLEWKLFQDIFPENKGKRSRETPHTPFRNVLNTLLYILITGCRWCDVDRGKQWASKSSATNSVRPMLEAWTNQRFVMVKTMARAESAFRISNSGSNEVAR